jgi:hypothetical protein
MVPRQNWGRGRFDDGLEGWRISSLVLHRDAQAPSWLLLLAKEVDPLGGDGEHRRRFTIHDHTGTGQFVESPPGSMAVAWPADSQLRVRVAGAPGLEPVESWPAAFRTLLIKGFPEPTSMSMWPVADAADELVAVKAISQRPACEASGVQAKRPAEESKLAPFGRSRAVSMLGDRMDRPPEC